jgi:tRNA(fMet)-specific endonuclease VapC
VILHRPRLALSRFIVWPYTNEAAAEYGRIFAELRRIGPVIQQIDIQIAAIARTLPNCIVVSKDADVLAISGVTVENWAM